MRYLKIYVIIPIFTLILVFCLPPKNANSDNSNETVIADVDGNPITLAELRLAINSLPVDYQQMAKTSMSQMMLQQLIDLKLFSVKADVENITNKISYRTELKFLVDQLKREHYLRLLYAQKITKDLIRDRYELLIAQLVNDEEIRARHILLETIEEAEAVVAQLNNGADFSQLAAEKSLGPTASNGGDLGFFSRESMVPEFSNIAFLLDLGEVSKPVKTKFGWHVIKLEERRAREVPDFDLVEGELREEMQRTVMTEALVDARKNASINFREVNLPDLLSNE